jgi:long-chain acyl-CoA synthetase
MGQATYKTIPEAFDAMAEVRGNHTAVIYLGTCYSYHQLQKMVCSFSKALIKMGIKPGQRVMIYIPNSIQWVVTWLAIQRVGAVSVPITPIYTPHDLKYIANDSDAEVIVCADINFGYVKRVLSETRIRDTVFVRMTDLLPWWKRKFGYLFNIIPTGKVSFDEHTFSFKSLLSANRNLCDDVPGFLTNHENLAEILYTGGTTKHPKGVPITQNLFLSSFNEQIRASDTLFPAQENVVLCNTPLFHILGQTCGLSTLLVGGTLMVQPKINLDATFEAIGRFNAKSMIGVPTLYRMILEHDRLDQYNLKSVDYWYSAGDVLPVEVGKRWRERFGKTIYQGYGATETCGGVSMCPTDIENPPKSVGRIVTSKQVKIMDPVDMVPVKPGKAGELFVSSKHMVSCYLNKPEETENAFVTIDEDLWYRTGDIMSMDDEGNLFFVDRTVDTIKHKGYRISASEIEAVLQEHQAVISACVIGIPDKKVGERIKAYVVLKEDIKGITGYELIKWCREILVAYKVPQYIEFRDMLPKSKVGKLLRREIRGEEKRRSEI